MARCAARLLAVGGQGEYDSATSGGPGSRAESSETRGQRRYR